jgi:hypothetical protein
MTHVLTEIQEKEKALLFFESWDGEKVKHVRLIASKNFVKWQDINFTNKEILRDNYVRVSPAVEYEFKEGRLSMILMHADKISTKTLHRDILYRQ